MNNIYDVLPMIRSYTGESSIRSVSSDWYAQFNKNDNDILSSLLLQYGSSDGVQPAVERAILANDINLVEYLLYEYSRYLPIDWYYMQRLPTTNTMKDLILKRYPISQPDDRSISFNNDEYLESIMKNDPSLAVWNMDIVETHLEAILFFDADEIFSMYDLPLYVMDLEHVHGKILGILIKKDPDIILNTAAIYRLEAPICGFLRSYQYTDDRSLDMLIAAAIQQGCIDIIMRYKDRIPVVLSRAIINPDNQVYKALQYIGYPIDMYTRLFFENPLIDDPGIISFATNLYRNTTSTHIKTEIKDRLQVNYIYDTNKGIFIKRSQPGILMIPKRYKF